jgi:ATP-dependent RNA helicase DeaD
MNFNELNLKKNLQSNILESGFSDMTEIQQNIIPKILDGVDIIGQAPTGTGKTLAFAIPTINNIDPNNNNIQVIALCPTRELTIQVGDEYKKLCKNLNINILTIYGGQPIDKQIRYLNQSKPQIIVSTPGRLLDHIKRNSINVKTITSIILDEADVMLDMGFGRDVDRIFQTIQNKHQTILISATIPEQILSLSKKYQSNPFLHKVHMTEESKPDIKQYFVLIKHNLKLEAIKQILKNNPFYLAMIFTNTK